MTNEKTKETENEKKRILVVEDDSNFLKSLEIPLKNHFIVDTARSLESALTLLETNKYDIVSTDGALPVHDGWGVGSRHEGVPLRPDEYRGNIVAEKAKEKGIYVIGLTMDPKKLTKPDVVISKKRLMIMDYIKLLKEKTEKSSQKQDLVQYQIELKGDIEK